jgi:hypothetical protein
MSPTLLPLQLLALLLALPLLAQSREPHVGYVYPAGGSRGSTFETVIGGQFLNGTSSVYCSGKGVKAVVLEYHQPMPQKRFNELREELKELQQRRAAARREANSTNQWTTAHEARVEEIQTTILKNPVNRQGNPALAERVAIQVTIAPDAEPGRREVRVLTPNGLSNPLGFCVGELKEYSLPAAQPTSPEFERLRKQFGAPAAARPAFAEMRVTLPATINGQILPGGVDRFRFAAQRGQELVLAAHARTLIPYLADAVPGWFQATLALYDTKGTLLEYNDDFQFRPDPVLHCVIPHDGDYVIEIKDAIYRGREDFVYRIEAGELPYVTSVFPLGGALDATTAVQLAGWNLTSKRINYCGTAPGVQRIGGTSEQTFSSPRPFTVDARPEQMEREPNNAPAAAQLLAGSVAVNGRIDEPGDMDTFRFEGRAGEEIVVEVWARRLESPLDSVLTLVDESGKRLAINDDHEDKASGLDTHHADSYLRATLPREGIYCARLTDRQGKGGSEFGYRLRLGPPEPDFELRVVPSAINVRNGATVPITVYALRKDGFTNEIKVILEGAPAGFSVRGGVIPAGQDKVELKLIAPAFARGELLDLLVQGKASIQGKAVVHNAVPADDLMQAFIYRHLVPAQELKLAVSRRGTSKGH